MVIVCLSSFPVCADVRIHQTSQPANDETQRSGNENSKKRSLIRFRCKDDRAEEAGDEADATS